MINRMILISPSSTSLIHLITSRPHMRMVCIYCSLFLMHENVRHTISFYFEINYWQRSWCHKIFKCLAYRQLSANFMFVTTILFTHTPFLWATCCLICFITIVKPFLTLILTTVHTVYVIWKKGSLLVWSIDRGCLLLHCNLSHFWYIQRSVTAHYLMCNPYWTYEIEYCTLFSVISSNIVNKLFHDKL
jgi:hypothetical protein